MKTPKPSSPTAVAPLIAQMRQASDASRAALESFGFNPEAYENILSGAAHTHDELENRNAPNAAARIKRLAQVFDSAIHEPVTDLHARGRAYLALLDLFLLQSLARETVSPRWLARLDRQCEALESGRPEVPLALFTVAGMVAEIGATVLPGPGDLATVTYNGWRFALVGVAPPDDHHDVARRVADAIATLKVSRLPGMAVIDLTDAVCPERRPLRATHPDAGAAELRTRLDRLLNAARDDIRAAADPDHAIGVVGTAFLSIHLFSTNQIAYITAYRMMSLLDPTDPRERKLTHFRRAFGDL